MVRRGALFLALCLSVCATSVSATEPTSATIQSASIDAQRAETLSAAALIDRLVKQGVIPAAPKISSDQTCTMQCDRQFVTAYQSCITAMAKLNKGDTPVCGRAALSGLAACQSECHDTVSERPIDQASLQAPDQTDG